MSFRIINDLVKPRITLASTLTAAVGYTMARGKIDYNILQIDDRVLQTDDNLWL